VREVSGSADPFHFAGHGEYLLGDPLASRLKLAGSSLTLGELFDEMVPVAVGASIVLPACETWMTDYGDPADEQIGIAGGFLFAGAASVLSTQWAVDDLAAALIIARYYESLARRSPAGALADAQRTLRSATRRDVRRLMRRTDALRRLGFLDERSRQELDRIAQGLSRRRVNYSHPIYWAAFTVTAAPG
jgi:CHAT domain-containing protein